MLRACGRSWLRLAIARGLTIAQRVQLPAASADSNNSPPCTMYRARQPLILSSPSGRSASDFPHRQQHQFFVGLLCFMPSSEKDGTGRLKGKLKKAQEGPFLNSST